MDMDDDIELGGNKPPPYDAPRGGSSAARDASPLPAPTPIKPTPLPRESLDGETIFAVGDEDRLTDDEDDEIGESKRLNGKDA